MVFIVRTIGCHHKILKMLLFVYRIVAYLYNIRKLRHRWLSLVVVLVVLGFSSLIIACDARLVTANNTPKTNQVSSMNETSQIELNIFSGRPDPTWTITNTEIAHLISQVQKLPATQPKEFADNLGYRGFTVRLNSNDGFIKVYQGICEYQLQGKSQFFHDEDRQLEKQLLATGKPYLLENLYNDVLQEIEK